MSKSYSSPLILLSVLWPACVYSHPQAAVTLEAFAQSNKGEELSRQVNGNPADFEGEAGSKKEVSAIRESMSR